MDYIGEKSVSKCYLGDINLKRNKLGPSINHDIYYDTHHNPRINGLSFCQWETTPVTF